MTQREPWLQRSRRPLIAILGTALVASLLATYALVFLGRSVASPDLSGAPLIYPVPPYHPGSRATQSEWIRGADVGAFFWQHLAYARIQSEALANGEMPLWNRFNSAGVPLYGQGQSLIGDPLHWITVLGGGSAGAWDLKLVVSRVVLTVGVGLMVYAGTGSLGAALVLTASSAFLGFFVFRLSHPAHQVLTYAPWLLWAWLQAMRAPPSRQLSWLALVPVVSWLHLAGTPPKEGTIVLLAIQACGAGAFLTNRSGRSPVSRFALVVAAGGTTILLTAPHWLVFLSTLANALTPYDRPAVTFAAPELLIGYFDILFGERAAGGLLTMPSLNLLALAAVLWALAVSDRLWREPAATAAAITAIAALAVAMGAVPAELIVRTPFLANIWHIDNTFGCAALVPLLLVGGFGVREFLRTPHLLRGWVVMVSGLVALALIAPAGPAGPFLTLEQLELANTLALLTVAASLAMPAGAALLLSGRAPILAGAMLLAAFVLVHGRFAWHGPIPGPIEHFLMNAPPRADFAVRSSALIRLQGQMGETGRVVGVDRVLFPGFNAYLGLESINGPDALFSRRYVELLDAAGLTLQPNWSWLRLITAGRIERLERVLDLLNVRHIAAMPGALAETPTRRLLARSDLDLFERTGAWPRAFWTDRIGVADAAADVARLIETSDGHPFAAVSMATLDAMPGGRAAMKPVATGRHVPAAGYELRNNETSFVVEAPGAGVIVLTETYWASDTRVLLNGRVAEAFPVNHAFVGMAVPRAGHYEVRVSYRPRVLPAALTLGAFGLVMVLGLATRRHYKERRAQGAL